jgi:hypothetical protein
LLPRRAQSGPYRKFPTPPRSSRQQQIGDICAGDQQHEYNGPSENQYTRAEAAKELIALGTRET